MTSTPEISTQEEWQTAVRQLPGEDGSLEHTIGMLGLAVGDGAGYMELADKEINPPACTDNAKPYPDTKTEWAHFFETTNAQIERDTVHATANEVFEGLPLPEKLLALEAVRAARGRTTATKDPRNTVTRGFPVVPGMSAWEVELEGEPSDNDTYFEQQRRHANSPLQGPLTLGAYINEWRVDAQERRETVLRALDMVLENPSDDELGAMVVTFASEEA